MISEELGENHGPMEKGVRCLEEMGRGRGGGGGACSQTVLRLESFAESFRPGHRNPDAKRV